MIEARRPKSTFRLAAVGIQFAAVLLAASSIALSQEKAKSANVQFAAGQSALKIPFDFEFNEIVLTVRVNDSAPMKFMFDTGAGGSLVSTRVAADLNLKKAGAVDATGVGGSIKGFLASRISLSVPGVRVANQRVAVVPLDFPFCEGRDIAGIIGYDFIKEFVVEIDYEARMISLFEPSSYQYSGRGDVMPLTITNTPRVHARIALPGKPPIEGLFEIDTGSDGVLSINSPFVSRHKLLGALSAQGANKEKELAGESERIDARLGSLQLGRFTIATPIVSFSLDTKGSLAAEDNDGPLGNEILRRFKVTIDYSRQRMMLEPNAHLSDPFENDMSGIEIDSEGKDCRVYKVSGITEKSPAAEAGIVVGDEIIAIDGRPANQFTSTGIGKLLVQDGAQRLLTLQRDGKARVVKIKLRRLI